MKEILIVKGDLFTIDTEYSQEQVYCILEATNSWEQISDEDYKILLSALPSEYKVIEKVPVKEALMTSKEIIEQERKRKEKYEREQKLNEEKKLLAKQKRQEKTLEKLRAKLKELDEKKEKESKKQKTSS